MKSLPTKKRLRNSFWAWLHSVVKVQSETGAISQSCWNFGWSSGSRNYQDVPNAREHQCRERIVNHRLVVDRQQTFADRVGHGI